MNIAKLEIIKDYGKLSLNGYMYFRLTNWCGNIMYEIRGWKEDGEIPFDNDIKFTKQEHRHLYSLLKNAINTTKLKTPARVMKKGGTVVKIFNHFGEIDSQGVVRQFTYSDWGYGSKYDFRYWEQNYTDCWQGVRLTEEECVNLVKILEREFHFGN